MRRALGLFAAGWTLAACAQDVRAPHVVVLVLDTVRRDHVSAHGYERDTTPFLRELAREATVFENAWSTSGWTSPAHGSLFTGLAPYEHGATQESWSLAEHNETLAELLSDAGYETVGLVENPMLSARLGFAQGFARYEELWRDEGSGIDVALERFRGVLDERDAEAPLFAFVNLIGAHSPYDSSGAFRTRFLTDVDRGPTANHWREVFLGTAVFEERELQRLRDLYDGEIAHVDSLVRGMVEELRRAGLIEDTILVVTSDHGENLGEHGLVDHVFSLYRTTTQVPLIVRAPGLLEPGTRVAAPVQLTDVFATLARRAGVENRVTQRTELGLVDAPGERLVFCEYGFPRQAFEAFDPRLRDARALEPYARRLHTVVAGSLELVRGSDGTLELYDLAADPAESVNLAADPAHAETLRRLSEALDDYEARAAAPRSGSHESPGVDEETRRALRGLGYSK